MDSALQVFMRKCKKPKAPLSPKQAQRERNSHSHFLPNKSPMAPFSSDAKKERYFAQIGTAILTPVG